MDSSPCSSITILVLTNKLFWVNLVGLLQLLQICSNQNTYGTGIKCSSQNVITRPHQSLQFRLWDSTLVTFPYSIMIKLRAIGRCLFFFYSHVEPVISWEVLPWAGFKATFALWSACEKNSTQTIRTSWGELSWIKWNDGGDCELWLSPASTTSATPSPAASRTT